MLQRAPSEMISVPAARKSVADQDANRGGTASLRDPSIVLH
jgi:hypothetical protein